MTYFTALAVPPNVSSALQHLAPSRPFAVHTHPDDFHLTLKYLGNPSPEALEMFKDAINQVSVPELTITLTGLTTFTNQHATVLVVLTNLPKALQHLQAAHESLARSLGISSNPFPTYVPHITLASFPPGTSITLPELPPELTFTTRHITLYQSSQPHGTGVARYTPLYIFP